MTVNLDVTTTHKYVIKAVYYAQGSVPLSGFSKESYPTGTFLLVMHSAAKNQTNASFCCRTLVSQETFTFLTGEPFYRRICWQDNNRLMTLRCISLFVMNAQGMYILLKQIIVLGDVMQNAAT